MVRKYLHTRIKYQKNYFEDKRVYSLNDCRHSANKIITYIMMYTATGIFFFKLKSNGQRKYAHWAVADHTYYCCT